MKNIFKGNKDDNNDKRKDKPKHQTYIQPGLVRVNPDRDRDRRYIEEAKARREREEQNRAQRHGRKGR